MLNFRKIILINECIVMLLDAIDINLILRDALAQLNALMRVDLRAYMTVHQFINNP